MLSSGSKESDMFWLAAQTAMVNVLLESVTATPWNPVQTLIREVKRLSDPQEVGRALTVTRGVT